MIFYVPIVLMALATTVYHVAQKSVPSQVSPLLSLTVNYVTALVVTLLLLPLYPAHDRVLVFQECELGELRGGGVHRRSGIGRLAGIPGRLENQPGLSRRKRHNSIVACRGWVAFL